MTKGRGEVLPDSKIRELIQNEVIIGADESNINSSSLDLRLGNQKWKILGSTLPLRGQTVRGVLSNPNLVDDDNNDEEFYIDLAQPYVVKLTESLDLVSSITAKLENKSGRGRIGISMRGLVDRVSRFNHIPRGYRGCLYAEISATAFPFVMRADETTMPQIIFYNGVPQPLKGIDLDLLLQNNPILTDAEGNPSYDGEERREMVDTGEMTFHADLSGEVLVYRARKDRRTIVLGRENEYNPDDFFVEERRTPGKDGTYVIHPGEFILIKSKENIRLPPEFAGEISEFSSDLGDLKTHYAGWINAGHGYTPDNPNDPSYIVFEAKARDTPVTIQDGQSLARFWIHRMLETPEQEYMARRSTNFNDLRSFLPKEFKKD